MAAANRLAAEAEFASVLGQYAKKSVFVSSYVPSECFRNFGKSVRMINRDMYRYSWLKGEQHINLTKSLSTRYF